MIGTVRRVILGSPLPTAAARNQRIGISRAIGAFGLDALSSVAYGPDEILYVLVLAGAAGTAYNLPIAIAIVVLLAIVVTSYRQTIFAYPRGGGSYTVASRNLGRLPGLTAGAALMVDYVTTLAVSVTAGVEAIIAFVPALDHQRVSLDLVAILILVVVNLRGVREAGAFFVLPTYVFVLSLGSLLAVGLWQVSTGHAHAAGAAVRNAAEPVSLFLLARAFAGGCTAMTGVEAIANGVPVFKKPDATNAARTLLLLAGVLAALFLGVAYLGNALGARPSDQASVIAQVGRSVVPGSPLFYIVQISSAVILLLAANTSFNGFPLLAAIMARDDFLPHQFSHRGRRLAFSNGILIIGGLGAVLVLVFGGSTHALIPLFAIGVFLSFTLSQAGMVRHWLRERGARWRFKLAVNGLGACTTGLVTAVVVITKFSQGAWTILILVPALVLAFRSVDAHYGSEKRQVARPGRLREGRRPHRVVVPVAEVNRSVQKTLEYALASADDVTAVHVATDPAVAKRLEKRWKEWAPAVPLVIVDSPYREVVEPLVGYIRGEMEARPDHQVMVMIPEVVPRAWIEESLHNQTTVALLAALRHVDGVALGQVPFRLG
ncbi:MAG: APC family permease [Candidatus Dormibacteria bacterium]